MQVTQTSADGLKREYKVVISAKDLDEKLDHRLRELGRSVRVPGFRPGKVPSTILRQRFGQAVLGEIVERSVTDSANQAMTEQGVRPALQPKIEITSYEEGSDLEYTMAVELLPEIEPADLSKIELERLKVKVGEAEIEDALTEIAQRHKRSEPVAAPRKSQSGDVLVIDFKGFVDGEEFAGGAATDHHLELGSNAFIAGFEEQLIGVGAGDHVTVKVTFPAEYANDKLAGKEAAFEVDVKEIREPAPVPIDDELAKVVGLDDLAALKSAVKESIERDYASLTRGRLKRALLDALADGHDFEVPPGMADLEFETIWKQIEEQRKSGHLDEEDAAKSEDQLKSEYRGIAERRVRLGLLLSEIGRRNNIEVSKDEITRAIVAEAQNFPGREREVFEFYEHNAEAMANLRAPVFEEKVVDFILEMAKVSDREVTREDLMAMAEEGEAPAEGGGKKAAKSGGAKKSKAAKAKKT